jgi:hypothetical protein
MMWMHMLADYWEFSGDEAGLRSLRPALRRLLSFLSEQGDEAGILRSWPAGQFWEWAPITGSAEACLLITNAFLCRAQERLRTVPVLADLFPDDADERLSRRRGVLHDLFWVPERGLYRDALPEVPARNTGFCHGWAAGPAYLLPRYLLGARPVAGWGRVGRFPGGERNRRRTTSLAERSIRLCFAYPQSSSRRSSTFSSSSAMPSPGAVGSST